ncbi:MAG: tRNA-dihydrouridine synthase [Parcubacteria group bacterium Gr01-1014_72]|nr:MAG: tRNA-dihydrouridine synthase [Parcubacteria group bacterium Gr01-1014_72]
MSKGFWEKLKRPIIALAPMADVTDAAFRRIIAKYSKPAGPDVMFTEFVSADGLCSAGRPRLLADLSYTDAERPIVAQLFSGRPEKMEEAAALVARLGFDGLDINMGCPDRSIEKSGAGAALIKDSHRAREIIRAAMRGAPTLPVSVKTRIGYNKDELETWLPELIAEGPVAVTIHARTRKEMSDVPAHWDRIKRAVEIRDALRSRTLILGNGDVESVADARAKAAETGADGVMLGRAIFGTPWLFQYSGEYGNRFGGEVGMEVRERLQIMCEHAELFEKLFTGHKNFSVMKKHFKAYVNGFDGAKELRAKLMETNSAKEAREIIRSFKF